MRPKENRRKCDRPRAPQWRDLEEPVPGELCEPIGAQGPDDVIHLEPHPVAAAPCSHTDLDWPRWAAGIVRCHSNRGEQIETKPFHPKEKDFYFISMYSNLSIDLVLSFYLLFCLSFHPSIVDLFCIYLSVCLSIYCSIVPSFYRFVCRCIHPSIYLSFCRSICLFFLSFYLLSLLSFSLSSFQFWMLHNCGVFFIYIWQLWIYLHSKAKTMYFSPSVFLS